MLYFMPFERGNEMRCWQAIWRLEAGRTGRHLGDGFVRVFLGTNSLLPPHHLARVILCDWNSSLHLYRPPFYFIVQGSPELF